MNEDVVARAARRILTDDGYNIGVLYRGNRKPYQPRVGKGTAGVAALEKGFELCA